MALLVLVFVLGYGVWGGQAFQWGDFPADNAVLYACVGQRVQLTWTFTQGPGERLVDVRWLHGAAFSTDVMASYLHDLFLPNPLYAPRLSHLPVGGVTLNDVSMKDEGNYTVEVNGYDSSGDFFSHQRSVYLQVGDGLMIKDSSLHVRQDPVAAWDSDKKEWYIKLLCGTFTFRGDPPIDITWTTPTGEETPSTAYDDGHFTLALPSPVSGGNYTCHIDSHHLQDACAEDSEVAVTATVSVDEVTARLSVMEAELKTLKTANSVLQGDKQQLREELRAAEDERQQVVANVSLYVDQKMEEVTLRLERNGVTDSSRLVAFHAKLSRSPQLSGGQKLVLANPVTNIGQGYNSNTGVFTVPLSGLYFLAASGSVAGNNHRAYLQMEMNGTVIARSYAYQEKGHYQTGACNVIKRLSKGTQVWLESDGSGYFWDHGTSFSGFLIEADI